AVTNWADVLGYLEAHGILLPALSNSRWQGAASSRAGRSASPSHPAERNSTVQFPDWSLESPTSPPCRRLSRTRSEPRRRPLKPVAMTIKPAIKNNKSVNRLQFVHKAPVAMLNPSPSNRLPGRPESRAQTRPKQIPSRIAPAVGNTPPVGNSTTGLRSRTTPTTRGINIPARAISSSHDRNVVSTSCGDGTCTRSSSSVGIVEACGDAGADAVDVLVERLCCAEASKSEAGGRRGGTL